MVSIRRKWFVVGAVSVLVGAGALWYSRPKVPGAPSRQAHRIVSELRALPESPLALPPVDLAGAREAPAPTPAVLVAMEHAEARVTLPGRSTEPLHVEDGSSGLGIDVRVRDVFDVVAQSSDGYYVYPHAHASGGTLLHRDVQDGAEDLVSFETRPAKPEVAYDVTLGKVRGLRLVDRALEMLDESGAPRLRMAPPYIVGADGIQTDAMVAVDGCAVDTNPAGPWGRAVTTPGSDTCRVRVSWPDEGVRYPAVLDPRWTTTESLSVPRQDHNMILLPLTGKVLAVGGRSSPTSTTGLSSAELYDKSTGTWALTGSMTGGRWSASATLLNSSANGTTSQKVLVAGGINGSTSLSTAQLYSQATGTWAAAANLNAPRHLHAATLLADGRVLVAGGMNGTAVLTTAALYNPASGSGAWTPTTGPIPPPGWRSGTSTLIQTTNSQLNNKVLLVGGNNGTSTISSVFLFDPSQSAFSTMASMPSPREGHTALALPGGKILFAGGKNGSTTLASAVIFDPGFGPGSWATTGSMTSPRWGHTATLLPTGVLTSGQVLVAGGSNGTTTLSSTDLWNGSTWTADGAMVAPVQQHLAVSIGSSVLVAGGINGGATVNAAELYDPSNGLRCTSGSQCASGFCVNGVCCDTACNQGCGACNLTGKVGVCSPIASGTLCRGVAGPCDVPESCSGTSVVCPADTFLDGGTTCRLAAGECDLTENCTGTGPACPPDLKLATGTPCPDDGNVCTTDLCDGTNAICQHAAGNAGTICRTAAGECDVAEACSGASSACPADAKKSGGTACTDDGNGCTNDRCDGANDACGHPNACLASQVCASNACCTPQTCAGAKRECGQAADGCGGTLNCGTCPNASHCNVSGACVPDPSVAGLPTGVDVCELLVQDLTVFTPIAKCHDCELNPFVKFPPDPPECCNFINPGACLTPDLFPECTFLQFIDQVEQIIAAGQVYCSSNAFSAENFVDALVGGQIQNEAAVVAAGLPASIDVLYHLYLEILVAAGRPIPANVQTIIADLVSPVYDGGATGFSFADLQNVKIVSSDLPAAGKFIPSSRLAITLGPVIVVRSDLYNALTDPANAGITTNALLNQPVVDVLCTEGTTTGCARSPDFLDGVDKLIHELVHRKQYDILGEEGFLQTYALSTIDYWAEHKADNVNSAFELEAYSYEAKIAQVTGGNYCLSEKPYDDGQLQSFIPPPPKVVCM
jgi:hypothetical protein